MVRTIQITNLLVFSFIILYFNFAAKFNSGDDVWASSQTLNLDGIVNLYLTWSGRVIAYVLQIFMIHNPLIFRITNSVVMIGMPVVTWILLDPKKSLNSLTLCIFLFLLYDYKEMLTAGLVTTYITYYWSLFINILFYVIIRHYLKSKNIISADLILAFIAGVIACNSELGAFVNTIILFVFMLAEYCQKKTVNKKTALMLSIPLLSLVFFLTCPGLHNRTAAETITWYPEFSSFSAVYKFYLGFSETLLYYFSTKSIILIVFLGALSVCVVPKVFKKELNPIHSVLLLFCFSGFVITYKFNDLIVKLSGVSNTKAYLFLVFLLCFCFFVLMIVYRIFENSPGVMLLAVMTLILGLMTRAVMGFSPTLYASLTRTYLYCDFALLVAIYLVWNQANTILNELFTLLVPIPAYPYFISNLFFQQP
jgi:hypothetical protein